MIEAVMAMLAGAALLAPILKARSVGGRVTSALQPFATVIGVVALVVGILAITSVIGVALITAGLVLAIAAVGQVPKVGPHLRRAGERLDRFRVAIGLLVLIIGIVSLLV